MKHLGDITKINGAEIEPVDVVTAGSPCQDLSVAGKREGLKGERSGLFMEQMRIIKEMREHDKRVNGRTDADAPLCWVRCNGTGTVLWASEIEEFPIAVTKKHFGDDDSKGDIAEYL